MLGGTFSHNIDDKGRVVIPAKFKKELGLDFVITAGYDDTLMIMSQENFGKFLSRFDNAPVAKSRWLKRLFLGSMHEVSTDKQGRMQIPQQLREKIGLDTEAVLVGNGDMIEIWTPERWEAAQSMLENDKIIASMDELMF